MSSEVKLWNLGPSPNNRKVRITLGYKSVPYERIEIEPRDRSEIVAASGQSLAPTLQHGATVIFDSGAIMRYIESNIAREPRIYSEDKEGLWAIERWELFSRNELGMAVSSVFRQAIAATRDDSVLAAANAKFNAAADTIERSLAKPLAKAPAESGYLVGDAMSAADIVCASYIALTQISDEVAAKSPVARFFKEHLRLSAGRSRLLAWHDSVTRYDEQYS